MAKSQYSRETLNNIVLRAHYLANQMIYQANLRTDKAKGDPKVGGHSSASSCSIHILGAIHLLAKTGFDHIANKPHASPADHAYNYLLDLLLKDGRPMSLVEKNKCMMRLRAFPNEEYPDVFQSYHSAYDPDHHNFLPSGTVGIPQVNSGYLALAYRFAKKHGYQVPEAHFWAVMGDSEFREGSVFEATPDFAEREIGNLTWIVDYNRQSLDGHRITNKKIMGGTDNQRIENTMRANGWQVIQVRHGQLREELFQRSHGEQFKTFLEDELEDYEFQALLLVEDATSLHKGLANKHPQLKKFLTGVSPSELRAALRDLGGHDILALYEALVASKQNDRQPTIIIAHTIKGWGLQMEAQQGNHSSLPGKEEMDALRAKQGLSGDTLFAGFAEQSAEGQFLKTRHHELLAQMQEQYSLRDRNFASFQKRIADGGGIPESMNINTKMASYPHTQWMLGQCTAKLTRIANTTDGADKKPLSADEQPWRIAGEVITTMAPDVGTSTNLNPAMDGKIFGAPVVEDLESQFGVKDTKLPDLVPGEENSDRFVRFEIVEGSTMSCMGSYGRLRDILGIPILPLMTVYDFFIKRAHDQFFYNLYWKSSFILVGTPSGVTLSSEGAQHGWKSDFQIPNQVTWEPAFVVELDWILSDAIKRHLLGDNEGRTGVVIRSVTRGLEQKLLTSCLHQQARFKTSQVLLHPKGYPLAGATDESTVGTLDETVIMATLRREVLQGAYYLIDYRGYANYEPGDNVVHIFCMGALVKEAIDASADLLKRGIYGNVIVVTSPDLLVGNLAHETDYRYLKQDLQISGELYLQPAVNGSASVGEILTLGGRRVPIVSTHDGEPGLLDNIGSIIGTRHAALAVRKHSKCGRPEDIYGYHHLDAAAIVDACGKVLAESAMETVRLNQQVLQKVGVHPGMQGPWHQLWDQKS